MCYLEFSFSLRYTVVSLVVQSGKHSLQFPVAYFELLISEFLNLMKVIVLIDHIDK